jgi:hypothetical protein
MPITSTPLRQTKSQSAGYALPSVGSSSAASPVETPKAAGSAGWNSHNGPVCKDGSLDMRATVNKGKDKWPTKLDGTPDMRFTVNKDSAKKPSRLQASELTTQLFADFPDDTEPQQAATTAEDRRVDGVPISRTASIEKAFAFVASVAKAASQKINKKWNAHGGPVCNDGSLDMRAAVNKGKDKWPKCADGSFDRRFAINRGKTKTAEGTLKESLAI